MDKKEFLNSKYLQLCQQLGDALIKSDQLNEHIKTLKLQIESLNTSFNTMSEYDSLRAQKARESARATNE